MSLMSAIRRATGGGVKPRLEDEKPEAEDEEDLDPNAEGETEENPEDVEDDTSAEEEVTESEDDEEEVDEKSMNTQQRAALATGRKAERKRIGNILGSKAAAANPELATHLAFKTRDSAPKAIATLKAAGSGQKPTSLASRMSARSGSALGRGGEASARSREEGGGAWDGALAKAGVARKAAR